VLEVLVDVFRLEAESLPEELICDVARELMFPIEEEDRLELLEELFAGELWRVRKNPNDETTNRIPTNSARALLETNPQSFYQDFRRRRDIRLLQNVAINLD
jgi:hypothetical protein